MVGLAGMAFAAQVVVAFEDELQATVALAFFLPGIVYMADAVGTQTETLVVRGLSVGISSRRMVFLESLTGAVVGALLAVAVFPVATVIGGDSSVALVVSLSLLAASSIATLVAMALPLLIDHLGFDPAFGSGPLATVVQDLLSIVIYFGVAIVVLG
jgi:magnesium transporter